MPGTRMRRLDGRTRAAWLATGLLGALATAPVGARGATPGPLEIGRLWIRQPAGADGVVGVDGAILNLSDRPVSLLGITSPAAAQAGLCVEAEDGTKWMDSLDRAAADGARLRRLARAYLPDRPEGAVETCRHRAADAGFRRRPARSGSRPTIGKPGG